MSRNIKEIGKELLGKSLNSYHRRTGLTQLEKNNNIQDGILDGILSQVDDAYIEKTEQSNVIHLEGSGDGAVVLDSIEGNTMVNIHSKQEPTFHIGGLDTNSYNIITNSNYIKVTLNDGLVFSYRYICMGYLNLNMFKPNTTYTLIFSKLKGVKNIYFMDGNATNKLVFEPIKAIDNQLIYRFTTGSSFVESSQILYLGIDSSLTTLEIEAENPMIFEGDYTNKLVSQKYFEGLQSSFEEKVNDEGKYEIEILSNNKNLYNVEDVNIDNWMNSGGVTVNKINNNIVLNGTVSNYFDFRTAQNSWNANLTKLINKLPVGTTLTMSNNLTSEKNTINYWSVRRDGAIKYFTNTLTIQKGDTEMGSFVRFQNGTVLNNTILKVQIEVNNKATSYTISKQNKIKLLINEPLRALSNGIKDKLCIKDGKLFVERNCKTITFNGVNHLPIANNTMNSGVFRWTLLYDKDIYTNANNLNPCICDKYVTVSPSETWGIIKYLDGICVNSVGNSILLYLDKYKDGSDTSKQNLINDLKANPVTVVYRATQPVYEEVLNEYGEPVMLEGYENGTIYIDSTIVPTTTVRYTPKMESMKAVKEVNNNNIMLINDINESIIPYMMEIDFMIMEKEMATMSHNNNNNIRIIGEKSMTSMQKRTKEMLERLIKGKSLTKEDAKTRVTVYLNAGKITDEQAEELMLTIEEVYA